MTTDRIPTWAIVLSVLGVLLFGAVLGSSLTAAARDHAWRKYLIKQGLAEWQASEEGDCVFVLKGSK